MLLIVPAPCAGTSTAPPKAESTTSVMRLDVSVLPATTPAAGPETRISAGCAAASSIVATPPDERITNGSGSPALSAAAPSVRRYRATAGPR